MIEGKLFNEMSTRWKRINMRSVAHLMGVEFIHDLYNRHEPKINSIRFRHTITIWKDGIVNSYAPANEWDRLGELLSDQYYKTDPILIESTRTLYKRRRETFHKFIRHLRRTDLSRLSHNDLATLLIQFQSIVLGELYVLNFVQIEHGLNIAIKKIIKEIEPQSELAAVVFVDLIQTEKLLASQHERVALYRIVQKCKMLRTLGFCSDWVAKRFVYNHYEKYRYLYSAYGEDPASLESFWTEFQRFMSNETKPIKSKTFTRLLSKKSAKLLRKLNNRKLNVLIPLLVQGGLFRDANKALLGQAVRYRFNILDEISKRKFETRDNLNFYLLAEIIDLLRSGSPVNIQEIFSRRQNGIILTRYEDFKIHTDEDIITRSRHIVGQIINGQCASQGECIGECKIVLTKEDGKKVNKGDIMVAIGTDFDLIEAMYRSAAIITEEGGILSHASVVCREIGKPCCIGVKNATTVLRDGLRVKVNATRGEISIL